MIHVTESAGKRIKALRDESGIIDGGLRISVKAGGCSGLSYVFAWEGESRSGDQVIESPHGGTLFIDPKSLKYLDGTVLDCDDNMLGQTLVFKNPNAKSTCGCGSSFDV